MSIEKSKTKNVGSIVSLSYVLVSEIKEFPETILSPTINFFDILLIKSEWKNIYFSPETCGAVSKNKTDDAGTFYENSITFEYPSETEDVSENLKLINGLPILVIVKNLNGVEKLFGTQKNPMKIQFNQTTGEKVMDSTGYEIEISGATIEPPLFIKRS